MGNTSVTTKILRFLGTEKGLLTMSAIVALYAFVYQITIGEYIYTDTESYFQAYESLTNGNIDIYRTPTYPLFIGSIRAIIAEPYCYIIILLIQIIIFLFSVHFFYRLTGLIKNTQIAYWLTFIYGVVHIIPTWTTVILTESISISVSVFYIYYTIFAVKTKRPSKIWKSIICLLILIMIRPSFIYLVPMSFFIYIILDWRKKEERKIIYNGLLGSIIIATIFCGYCYQMKKSNGIFSPSAISLVNNYWIDRNNGSFDTNAIKDIELKVYADSIQNSINIPYSEALLIIQNFGCERMNAAINDSRKTIVGNVGDIMERTFKASRDRYKMTTRVIPCMFFEMFTPNMGPYFLILAIFMIYIIFNIYKKKYIPWKSSFLFLFAFGCIIVSIIGGPSDFGRLFMPSYPAVLLLTGILIQMIKDKSFLKNEFEE